MNSPKQLDLSRRRFLGKVGAATAVLAVGPRKFFNGNAVAASVDSGNAALRQPPDIVSPEVLPDRKVVFRLFAPNAGSVSIGGDYPIGDSRSGHESRMTKDEDGVWSVTLGPIGPDFYSYYYVVDGRKTLDLDNLFVIRDGSRYQNVLRVSAPELADYEVNDVPHGSLAATWYPSPTLGMNRRMYVYTPPGYEAGTKHYPVLYLLHGGGLDETGWPALGHATQILDNLMAQGRIRPMIVVMPNANANNMAARNLMLSESYPVKNEWGFEPDITQYPKSMVKDLIPFIDKTYRTRSDRENRAIAGLSVGGAKAIYAAFNHIDLFAYAASFSGGFPRLPGVAVKIEAPANADIMRGPDITNSIDPEKLLALLPQLNRDANSKMRLLYLSMGSVDGLITAHGVIKDILNKNGIKYTMMEREGYGHEWPFWRISLHDLLPRLFG